jgi:hypothetical protein
MQSPCVASSSDEESESSHPRVRVFTNWQRNLAGIGPEFIARPNPPAVEIEIEIDQRARSGGARVDCWKWNSDENAAEPSSMTRALTIWALIQTARAFGCAHCGVMAACPQLRRQQSRLMSSDWDELDAA